MAAAVLVDTNVLVYAHDAGEPARQRQALQVLDLLHGSGRGCLSVQCLSEFFAAVTRGRPPRLSQADAARQVERLALGWPVLSLTAPVVIEAVRGVRVHQLAFWDAQLWATARLNQVAAILSDDFRPGTSLEGIRFVNPFAPGFDPTAWA